MSVDWKKVWVNLGNIIWSKPVAGAIIFVAGFFAAVLLGF